MTESYAHSHLNRSQSRPVALVAKDFEVRLLEGRFVQHNDSV
jgi:hypothetical protein